VIPGVTVVIPSIPPRAKKLRSAVASALTQDRVPDAISIAIDHDHDGSAETRNRALAAVGTEWCAFLDDDDLLLPCHLDHLLAVAEATDADVVYPWPVMEGGADPRPDRFGLPFDPDELRRGSYIPVTSLVRTELAHKVGGFAIPDGSIYDDWGFYLAMLDAGARFVHLPERTWVWRIHAGNTSGQAHRW
jgi:glycosyltransferase involved in cell wall biosynthesis